MRHLAKSCQTVSKKPSAGNVSTFPTVRATSGRGRCPGSAPPQRPSVEGDRPSGAPARHGPTLVYMPFPSEPDGDVDRSVPRHRDGPTAAGCQCKMSCMCICGVRRTWGPP